MFALTKKVPAIVMKANSRQEMPVPGIIKSLSKLSSLQKNLCIFCLIVCVCVRVRVRVCVVVCMHMCFITEIDYEKLSKEKNMTESDHVSDYGSVCVYVCGCVVCV